MILLSKIFVCYLVWLFLYEKLHRYVYDYCYQNDNKAWGWKTAYWNANINNKYEKYNDRISSLYRFVTIWSWRWRKDIILFPGKKYNRYR